MAKKSFCNIILQASIFLNTTVNIIAQSHLEFTYDASGNRIAKEMVGNAPIPSITGDTLACADQSKVFTVTQGNVSAYLWDSGATTKSLNFTADSSRYRKVTVTYTNGCKNTGRRWIQVSSPVIGNLVGNLTASLNQTVSYSLSDPAVGANYTWEVTNGSFPGSNTTIPVDVTWNVNITPAALKVTRSENGCIGSKIFPITISGATPCPNGALTLSNPTNNLNQGAVVYKAGQTIGATNKITGGSISYDAGKSVMLNPGFEAKGNGVIFKAQITGCN